MSLQRRQKLPFTSDVSMRDEIAKAEVVEILKGLPADHPARLRMPVQWSPVKPKG